MKTYQADYDIACTADEVLEAALAAGLILTGYQSHGPGGGNPVLTLCGSQEAHEAWLQIYDPDGYLADGFLKEV